VTFTLDGSGAGFLCTADSDVLPSALVEMVSRFCEQSQNQQRCLRWFSALSSLRVSVACDSAGKFLVTVVLPVRTVPDSGTTDTPGAPTAPTQNQGHWSIQSSNFHLLGTDSGDGVVADTAGNGDAASLYTVTNIQTAAAARDGPQLALFAVAILVAAARLF